MNILFDINHPADVHLFRNAIEVLQKEGHHIVITSRDKDVTLELLDNFNLEHIPLSKAAKGLFFQVCELIYRQLRLIPILFKYKIRICISSTGACNVHICKLFNIPTLVFYDTEHAKLQNYITIPFATLFITPDCFTDRYGKRHIIYNGIHDLAYLHPKYFSADSTIYDLLNLSNFDKFIIFRFVSWQAVHDIGQKGISLDLKRKIIQLCSKYAKIFIVSEEKIDEEFAQYRFPAKPEKMHDALSFATLYIGEGASMATEAAVMGTPSIFISTLRVGVLNEFEHKYGLILNFYPHQETEILKKVETLLNTNDLKTVWEEKKNKFLENKVDLTQLMIDKILEYA